MKENLQSINTSREKISKWSSIALSKKNHLEAIVSRSGIRKTITTHKSQYSSHQCPFVLIWSNLFSSLLQQPEFDYSGSYKARASKLSSWTKSHVAKTFAQKAEKLFAKGDSYVDKILSCPYIKLSNLQTLVLDGVLSGVSL